MWQCVCLFCYLAFSSPLCHTIIISPIYVRFVIAYLHYYTDYNKLKLMSTLSLFIMHNLNILYCVKSRMSKILLLRAKYYLELVGKNVSMPLNVLYTYKLSVDTAHSQVFLTT